MLGAKIRTLSATSKATSSLGLHLQSAQLQNLHEPHELPPFFPFAILNGLRFVFIFNIFKSFIFVLLRSTLCIVPCLRSFVKPLKLHSSYF